MKKYLFFIIPWIWLCAGVAFAFPPVMPSSGGTTDLTAPGPIGGTTPAAGTFTTLGAGAGGFTVDADGDITGNSFTAAKTSGVAGQNCVYTSSTTDLFGICEEGPDDHRTANLLMKWPDGSPAGSFRLYGTPSSNRSTTSWVTPGTGVATAMAATPNATGGLVTFSGNIGAATATSLMATGRVDGTVGMTITTDATTISSTSNKAAYYINNGDSAAKGIYTLPAAAAGLQYCIALYSEHATGATAVMKFQTSASGQYIALDGVRTASGGLIKSTGAAGDAACVVGISATEWIAYHSSGTWSKD
jgi:hypothetical protein